MYRGARHLVTESDNFEQDCDYFFCKLTEHFDWFQVLNISRQVAVLSFALAVGWKNFVALTEVINLLSDQKFEEAALEIAQKGYDYIANALKIGEIKFAELI